MSRKAVLMFSMVLVAVASGQPATTIGRVDMVGGTTYDQLTNGPTPLMVYCDPPYGIHVVWLYSTDTGLVHPDRNARYNYYDFALHAWNWIDPDFMVSGVNLFTERAGLGNIDVDPNSGRLYICSHTGYGIISPILARDIARGAGIFEYCSGSPTCDGFLWPMVSVGHSGSAHVALTDDASRDGLYYSRVDPWCNWSTPFHIPPPMPDPGGVPAYLIVASKRRPSVCIFWADMNSVPRQFYCRRSTDDGMTWLPPESLPLPPAFSPGGDTTVSGVDLYPWYDPDEEEDDIHLAASVIPIVAETSYASPAEIWHWSERFGWSRVARAEGDSGRVGYNAVYACRPSLGKTPAGELVCVWEQFDSTNVEPRTGLLRADIWAARGDSTGQSWGIPVRLTSPDSTSKRFPSLAGQAAGDTIVVSYLTDLCAGFAMYQQGPATYNPYAVQWVPLESLPPPLAAVNEPKKSTQMIQYPQSATVVRGRMVMPRDRYPVRAVLIDATGRRRMDLQPGENDIRCLMSGIYFVREASGIRRVVVQR